MAAVRQAPGCDGQATKKLAGPGGIKFACWGVRSPAARGEDRSPRLLASQDGGTLGRCRLSTAKGRTGSSSIPPSGGFAAAELRELARLALANQQLLLRKWNEHFITD